LTPRSRYQVTLLAAARDVIVAASETALPRETGGILIGWRGGGAKVGCTVVRAVEVPDARSGRCTYQRSHAAAETAMRAMLDELSDPELGYVGEWHSHPKNQPPSPQDRGSIRGAARLAGDAVVLVVPSLHSHEPPGWTWHALVARRAARLPAVVARTAALHLEEP
jgi:integrative and conjugative element protein (TIGR02256 family)